MYPCFPTCTADSRGLHPHGKIHALSQTKPRYGVVPAQYLLRPKRASPKTFFTFFLCRILLCLSPAGPPHKIPAPEEPPPGPSTTLVSPTQFLSLFPPGLHLASTNPRAFVPCSITEQRCNGPFPPDLDPKHFSS